MYYLIRVKDGTIGGITRSLELPKTAEFDYKFKLTLTNRTGAKNRLSSWVR